MVTELRELGFSTGEADLKEHWGMRTLHARVFSLPRVCWSRPVHLICTIMVVSGGIESPRCEAPSPVLVVIELRDLVFQLERPT